MHSILCKFCSIAQSSLNIAHLNSIHFAVNLVIDFHFIILSFLITWLLDNVWILSLYREK